MTVAPDNVPSDDPVATAAGEGTLTHHRRALEALTGIRFVAAMQVVFVHHGSSFVARLYAAAPMVDLGWLAAWNALTFFFLLSGFILAYTYTGQMSAPGSWRRFWEARFARVYPVYLLALLLSYPFSRPGLKSALACLFMVQTWDPFHPGRAMAWNFTAWSLSCEAFFYIIFPWLLAAMAHLHLRHLRTIITVTALFIVFGHTTLAEPESIHTAWIADLFRWTPTPLRRLPEFVLGIALGLHFLRSGRKTAWPLLLWAAIATEFVLLATLHGPWISLLVIPDAILLYELAQGGTSVARLLSTRVFLILGGASYSVYLLQFPVRNLLALLLNHTMPQRAAAVSPVLYPLVLIAASTAVFLWFEEPTRRGIRRWFAGRAGA